MLIFPNYLLGKQHCQILVEMTLGHKKKKDTGWTRASQNSQVSKAYLSVWLQSMVLI